MTSAVLICAYCEQPAPRTRGQVRQKYCGEACRRAAYNDARRDPEPVPGLCPVLAARLTELLRFERRGMTKNAPPLSREVLAR